MDQGRALARVDDGNGSMNTYHRHLDPFLSALAWIGFFGIWVLPLVKSGICLIIDGSDCAPDYSLAEELIANCANCN